MKYLFLLAGGYLAGVGISELLWSPLNSPQLASVAALPSLASLADSTLMTNAAGSVNEIEGGIDIVAGVGLILFGMRF